VEDEPETEDSLQPDSAAADPAGNPAQASDEVIEPEIDGGPGAPGGAVSVTVDKIQRPGAVVGGDVTFSDGVSAQWQIDQMGRLGIVPPKEGYQPPEADIAEFQTQLQAILQKQGF
jgi:hypothetical protein